MVKADIVRHIADSLGRKDKEALFTVDCIIDCLKDLIVREGRLEVRDFGVFQAKLRKSRMGRNPKNKIAYPIPSHRVVTFRSGKHLKNLKHATVEPTDDDE